MTKRQNKKLKKEARVFGYRLLSLVLGVFAVVGVASAYSGAAQIVVEGDYYAGSPSAAEPSEEVLGAIFEKNKQFFHGGFETDGAITLNSGNFEVSDGTFTVSGDVNVNSGDLYVDVSEDAVGVNTSTLTGSIFEVASSTGAIALAVNSGGYLGVGTASPNAPLEISGDGQNVVGTFISTDAQAQISFQDDSTTGISHVKLGAVGNDLALYASTTEILRLTGGGKIGINTTTPGHDVSIDPSAAGAGLGIYEADSAQVAAYLRGYNSGGVLEIYNDNSVDSRINGTGGVSYLDTDQYGVGIGTSTPPESLTVVGSGTSTIQVGEIGSPACLELRDSDDAGWSYMTVLNGTLTTTTADCST